LDTAYQARERAHALTRAGMPPVIVIGGGNVTSAAVLRLLHRAGIPTYTLCADSDFVAYSRWYRPLPGSGPDLAPHDLARLLASLSLESAVLLPCSDDWLIATAALPESLARRFPSSHASLPVVETLLDKWRLAQLLQSKAIPHPRTRLLTSIEQLDSLPSEDFLGAILKPPSSESFSAKFGVKGFLVDSRAQALRAMERLPFPIMLQEFIPGPPTAGYFIEGFIDRQGRVCALFARRRLRMYPPHLGNSTFMVSVPLEEVAAASASLQFLLQTLSYRGTFSVEFKYDERDRSFKLLEINARPWWYVDAPARAGMDVCSMAYRDALELPIEPVTAYQAGHYLGFLPGDFHAWRYQRDCGGPGFWSWLRSWRGARSTPFCWNDPLPPLAFLWRRFANYIRHSGTRMTQLEAQPSFPGLDLPVHSKGQNLAARR
jgi:predicted ATP-grasp superfamily ATP-dependent carboligase